jgi:hypothetical protein
VLHVLHGHLTRNDALVLGSWEVSETLSLSLISLLIESPMLSNPDWQCPAMQHLKQMLGMMRAGMRDIITWRPPIYSRPQGFHDPDNLGQV